MKKRIFAVLLSFFVAGGFCLCPAAVRAEGVDPDTSASVDAGAADENYTGMDDEEDRENDNEEKQETSVAKAVFCSGTKGRLLVENAKGAVTWSVGDKDILQIVKKTNKTCKIKALKDGKTIVRASAKNKTTTFKVTVKSGKEFVKAWCRLWVDTNITDDMSDKRKLVTASSYITSSGMFYAGDTYEPEDLLVKGYGNCVSGGKLLVSMCEAMGYAAKLRFAAKDDMSRYPLGVIFASQHYNVEVIVNGKKYYADGMPGCWFTYLSTSKKPIYYSIFGMPVQD